MQTAVRIPFQPELLQQLDSLAKEKACSRTDIIIEATKMYITRKQIKNQIDWQFPNEREIISIDDFREMVRNSEKAPCIPFEKI